MTLFLDLSCTQDPVSAERGIPTYAREFARALEKADPALVTAYAIEGRGPLPAGLDFLLPGGKLQRVNNGRAGVHGRNDFTFNVWHDLSPFYETTSEYLRFIVDSRAKIIVTLYDLIPLLYADIYLTDAHTAARYQRSLAVVQRADRVMCISRSAADDAVRLLGLDPAKVAVVGTGVEARYRPAADRRAAARSAQRGIAGLRPNFLLYTGGIDHRKNMKGLLEAYSLLPRELRRRHQLVVVCRASADEKAHLIAEAKRYRIADDVLFTGFVQPDHLLSLYQSAHLFVFPSLYEGFGLPAAEAMACHTPSIVGNNSSLIEVMPLAEARFDATDPFDIARAIIRGLTDDRLRRRLVEVALQSDFSWAAVAERAQAVYASLAGLRMPEPPPAHSPRRPRLALVSPMPPAQSGVADYSARLVAELSRSCEVDVFTQADAARPTLPNVRWFQYSAYPVTVTLDGAYDDTIYCMGNSTFHYPVLELLRRERCGTVLQHDVNIQDMLAVARLLQPGLVSAAAHELLARRDAGVLPAAQQHYHAHTAESYYTYNSPLSAEVLRLADDFVVHNRSAATLVRLESAGEAGLVGKIRTVPFGHRPIDEWGRPSRRRELDAPPRDAVVSMGILHGRKRTVTIAKAFAILAPRFPDLTFALVGENLLDDVGARDLTQVIAGATVAGEVQVALVPGTGALAGEAPGLSEAVGVREAAGVREAVGVREAAGGREAVGVGEVPSLSEVVGVREAVGLRAEPSAGPKGRLLVTGRTSDVEYAAWLRRAKVAVQLRERSFGESSASIADCFSFGAPVIASDVGPVRELPGSALVTVDANIGPAELAEVIDGLLRDDVALEALSAAAIDHAEANSFAAAAGALLETRRVGRAPGIDG